MKSAQDVKPSTSGSVPVPPAPVRRPSRLLKAFASRNFNYAPILTEEVALEGLDGITLQGLWVRLEHRRDFNLSINEGSKNMLWDCLRRNRFVEFYELPVERPDLVYYGRMEYYDERGNTYEPLSAPEEIYLYAPVDDTDRRIRGSCQYYKERKNIGAMVRKLRLENAIETYGNRLVIVAQQEVRDKILFHNSFMDPKDLAIVPYCILERVGRARYHGESTRGKVSLSVMKMDAKTLFYHRKVLLAKQLMTKQAFSMKFGPNRISSLITIIHLPRFYTLYKSNQARNAERLFTELQLTPGYRKELAPLKNQYGKSFIKTALDDYSDVFEVQETTMGELYPERLELQPVDKMESFSKRTVRVAQLRNPAMSFTEFLAQRAAAKEDEEESDSVEKDIFVRDEIKCQTSVLVNCWKYFIQQYADGCTLAELSEKLSMFNLDARAVTRLTAKLHLVNSFVEDAKKTKVQRFLFYKCGEANKIIRDLSKSLPPESLLTQVSSSKFYSARDRNRLDARNIEQKPEVQESSLALAMCPHVEITEEETPAGPVQHIIVDVQETSMALVPMEEDLGEHQTQNQLQLEGMSSTSTSKQPLIEPKERIRATMGENIVFTPVTYLDTQDEHGTLTSSRKASGFTYRSLFGWQVSIELAEINPAVIKSKSFLVNSAKTVRRVKFILQQINAQKFISGSGTLLQAIRKYESELDAPSESTRMDRISLYRILKELLKDGQIQIWRIRLTLEPHERVIIGFTPAETSIQAPYLQEGINSHIRWLHAKYKRTRKQKLRDVALQHPDILKTVQPVTRKYKKIAKKKEKSERKQEDPNEEGSLIPGRRKSKKRVPKKLAVAVPRPPDEKPKTKKYYHDSDEVIRQRMNRLRCHWSPIEDTALLHVFIASILFLPRYNLERLVMYNSRQLRDVLHSKLKEARNKTTLALRRRFHFLMRRPEMLSRLRQNLAIAVRDKDLKFFIRNKYEPAAMSAANQSFAQVSLEGLTEVYDYLHELFEKGTVRRSSPVLVYARKRRAQEGTGARSSKRARFAEEPGPDPLDISGGADTSVDLLSYEPLEFATAEVQKSHRILGCTGDAETEFEMKLLTAKTALFSLLFSGHPSDVVIDVIDHIDESVLTEVLNYLKEHAIVTVSKSLRFNLALQMKRRLQNFLTPPMYNYANRVYQRLKEIGIFNATKVATVSSLHTLIEACASASFTSSMNDVHITLPRNVVDVNKEWKTLLKSSDPLTMDQPSTSAGAGTSRDAALPEEEEDSSLFELNLRDFKARFIKSLQTDQTASPNIFNLTLPHLHVVLKNIDQPFEIEMLRGPELICEMSELLIDNIPNAEELTDIEIPAEFLGIARAIYATGEKGVMILSLQKMFDETLVHNALRYLFNMKLAFIVGSQFYRVIGVPFTHVWIMPNKPCKDFKYIARPWLTSYGEINWQLVDQLLCSLIGYIELHPGCSVRHVASSLVPLISAVDGMLLLKLLHRFKLVELFEISQPGPPKSVFEQRRKHSIVRVDEITLALRFETLFIQMAEFYTLKYCTLQSRLEEVLGKEAFAIKSGTSYAAIDPRRRSVLPHVSNSKRMKTESSS